MRFHAYTLTNMVTGLRYVGITQQSPQIRWAAHRHAAQRTDTSHPLHLAIREQGEDAFVLSTVACARSRKDLSALERVLIAEYNTVHPAGYNLGPGGDGNRGCKRGPRTPELRARLSAMRLANPTMKGRTGARSPVSRPLVIAGVRYVSIGAAAAALDVCHATARKWAREGVPRSEGKHASHVQSRRAKGRVYTLEQRRARSESTKAIWAKRKALQS